MRALGIAAAALLVGLAFPSLASATFMPYQIYATVSGMEFQQLCDPSNPACYVSSPFTQDIGFSTFLNLSEGTNVFDFGSPYSIGEYAGTVIDTNGVLTGENLTFGITSCGPGTPTIGCDARNGTAATFTILPGVPEPGSWALMVVGFGAIGLALRRGAKPRARQAR